MAWATTGHLWWALPWHLKRDRVDYRSGKVLVNRPPKPHHGPALDAIWRAIEAGDLDALAAAQRWWREGGTR